MDYTLKPEPEVIPEGQSAMKRALVDQSIHFITAYVSVKDPATTKNGAPKNEVTLFFKNGEGDKFNITHTITGPKLSLIPHLKQYFHGKWCTVGIGQVEESAWNEKVYYRTMNVVWLLDIHSIMTSQSQPEASPAAPTKKAEPQLPPQDDEDTSHPF